MRTAISLFDDNQEAQRAVASLMQNGFDRQEITVIRNRDLATAQSLMEQAYIPEQDSRFYEEGVRQGGTLVIVRTDDSKSPQAVEIMSQHSMVDVDSRLAEYQRAGKQNMGLSQLDEEGQVIPVVEEQIQVGKRQMQRGGVRIHTHMSERPVEEQVSLREERVRVERRPVDRPVSDADLNSFKEGTVELAETAEEAVVAKQARVIEEVVVGKEVSERTETVRDSVRRTDVEVEQLQGGQRSADQRTDFAKYDSDFNSYYNTNLKNSGYTYEQYEPVYRYGYNLAYDPTYRDYDWNRLEPEARRRWEERNPGTWEQFKDSVRYAWDKARGAR